MSLKVGLSAVIVAAINGGAHVLATRGAHRNGLDGLPFGAFDPDGHRTFEIGLRDWVTAQTGFDLGYVEQLYTFGDKGRELPTARLENVSSQSRIISVGYLALTPEATEIGGAFDAVWRDWYRYFPWEDRRDGKPENITEVLTDTLKTWSESAPTASDRIHRWTRACLAFGLDGRAWVEERVLERYELLYGARIVPESWRDRGENVPADLTERITGVQMRSDHRRILATGMSRLRGKIKYRPVVFELMGETFTLSALQETVEGILGLSLHKQNFRRALDKTHFVEGTGQLETATGGRPAELFRFRREILAEKAALGVQTPRRR